MLTVDRCKPQKTKQTDPAVRCKEPEFTQQLDELEALGESLVAQRLIDRVLCLRSDDPWLKDVTRKYSGPWLPETHDYGGRPITGYWAGIEAAANRYVIHYDGDMFLYQEPDFDWALHAIPFLEKQERAISATPRPTPPYASRIARRLCVGARGDGRAAGGRRLEAALFFDSRVRRRSAETRTVPAALPRPDPLVEQMAVKTLRRGFPRSAEKMWWRTMGLEGAHRLILSTEKAWLLHPIWKPDDFHTWVPAIQESVASNRIPDAQLGKTELQLKEWQAFLSAAR